MVEPGKEKEGKAIEVVPEVLMISGEIILSLEDKKGGRFLFLSLGLLDASAIACEIRGEKINRPMAIDQLVIALREI